jgi:hypothetical protein
MYGSLWFSIGIVNSVVISLTILAHAHPDVISCSEPHNPDMETDPHSSDLGGRECYPRLVMTI